MSFSDEYLNYTSETNLDLANRSPVRTPQNSVIEKAVEVNYVHNQITKGVTWGSFNTIAFAAICFDLSARCPTPWGILQNLEFAIGIILFLNIVYHICCYIYYCKIKRPIQMTKSQQQLLGYPSDSTLIFASPMDDTISKMNSSLNLTAYSFERSWKNESGFNNSMNTSVPISNQSQGSPNNATLSPSVINTSNSKSPITPVDTSLTDINCIEDDLSLDLYLKEYDVLEKFNRPVCLQLPTNSTPIWSHPSSIEPPEQSKLINNQYQLAYTIAEDRNSRSLAKDKNSLLQYGFADFWKKRGINPNDVSRLCDNLRVWMSSTILTRLADEINNTNEYFKKHGQSELRVGSTCLERLRKSATMTNSPPTLATLIPFLDFTPNQEYLVHRIKELAQSRCMSDFRWNAGSLLFHGKTWDTRLPTDCAIIMHLFATYLDGQLVPLPQQPDGKPFTSLYLCTNISEKPAKVPGKFKIHQTELNPPNYILSTENGVHEPPKGRNNMFHTLILFLQYIKTQQHGMLGRVSLGPAGINILWVMGKK